MRKSLWLIALLVMALALVGCLGGSSGYQLTIKIEGEGRVVRDPDKTLYRRNTVVTLAAEPAEGWVFIRWEGAGLSGSDPVAQVTMTKNQTVTAIFGKPGEEPKDTGTVIGYVSDTQGGPAVQGATVTWNGTLKTTTDADGRFVLSLPAGEVGDILVERPDGGAARVQAVQVAKGEELTIDIPTRRSFDPSASMVPPTIELNVARGQILTGTVKLQIKATGENPAYVMYVYVGGEQRSPREGMIIEDDELEVSIDTTALPNGATYLRILAYDTNDNAAIYIVPVTIFNWAPWQNSPPGRVTQMLLSAETYAEKIGYYSKQGILEAQMRYSPLAVADEADLEAVPGDSMLIVFVIWSQVSNADGYKVYRSFDAENYHLIATVPSKHVSGGRFQVTDFSPQLAPGKRTFYKVVPYNSAGDGPGTVVDVTPLPPMDIYLVSPANGATGVELEPTFTWELRGKDQFPADTTFAYYLDVYDATYWLIASEEVVNAEEAKLSVKLNPGHVYTWDIADSVAWRTQGSTSSLYAQAVSYGGLEVGETNTGSRNGEFIFTTINEAGN